MATLQQIMTALPKADAAGDTEAVGRLSDAMRAHPTFQQNAKENLDRGDYKYADDGFSEMGKDEQRANMSKQVARSMGLKDSEVDVTQGMGTYGRFKLSFQPTEQDKVKHLEDTYGRENIRAVDIGGKMKLLYRDEQETGNQFRAVDEEGTSLADFFGDTAGEVLPTAGAIAGGVGGFVAGGPVGSVAGAAVGGALARGAQDVATRVVSGEDIQGGEIAGRALKEAALGAVIDTATLGTGKFFSRFGGKGLADGFQKGIAEASDVLQKRGLDVDLTAGMRTGADAAGLESKIAADRPKSKIAGRLAGIRDDLDNFRSQVSGGVDSREAFAKNIESIRTNYSELIAEVAAKDVEASKLIQKSLQKKIDRLGSASSKNLDQFGKQLQGIHSASRGVIDKTNNANFKGLKALAKEERVSVTKGEVVSSMKRGLAKFKVLGDENVNKLIKEIENGADTIGFQELRERLDQVADVISQSKVAGFSNKEKVATAVSDSVRNLRNRVAKRSSPEFSKAFDDTMEYYKNEFLSTRRGAVGTSLAEKLGASSTSPQSAARLILSDPENIRQTLRAAEAGGQPPPVVKDQLREAYRSSIGLERGTASREGFKYNREVVEELWGKRGTEGLDALNDAIARGKKPVAGMSDEDMVELLGAFSSNERNTIAKRLVQKGAAEAEADKLIGNKLIKKIINGDIDYFQNEEFAKHLLNSNQGDARKFLSAVPAGERQGIRQDVVTDLFGRAQNGAQKTSDGLEMWNPDIMGKLLSQHKNTLKEVLGAKTYGEIKAANTLLKAAESRGTGASGVKLRGAASGSGAHLFIVGDIFQSAKERFWGWAYGSGSLTKMLTGASKDQMKERMEKALPAMLSTSQGVQALARTTKEDPNLRDRVANELAPVQ